jgi:hypothetical protein
MQIAERLGMAEAAVAHDLHEQRSAEIGRPTGYAEPPSWQRRETRFYKERQKVRAAARADLTGDLRRAGLL